MTLPAWEERPLELANLLNPAFGALLLRDAAKAYQAQAAQALPYPLGFLILPIVLYKPTRDALPKSTAAILHAWTQEHPALQIQIADRVQRLQPYSREAILFALQHRMLRVSDAGGLVDNMRTARSPFPDQTEPAACRNAAGFVGRWFGKAANASLILTMWGLKP